MGSSLKQLWADRKCRNTLMFFGAVGLLLRFLFMPFTMHPDIFWVHMCASKMAYHGVFNIYEYVKINFYDSIVSLGTSYYPPLSYFILGAFHIVFKLFMPSIGTWLDKYSVLLASGDTSQYLELFKIPFLKLCSYLTVMKLPYLIFDMLCGLLLILYFNKPESSMRAFKFWMINPVVIFGSYIFGQFDVLIAFFLMLGLFFISRKRPYAGIFIIGSSILLKSSPLVLILPLSLVIGKDLKEAAKLLVVAFIPMVLLMTPFYLLTGDYAFRSIFMKFVVGGGAKLIDTVEFFIGKVIFLCGYLLILYRSLFKKDTWHDMDSDAWRYITAIILLSYFIVYTPIHYFQWVIPFLIIGVIKGDIPKSIYVFQIVCLFTYAICSRPLSAQLFLPLNPEYFYNLKSFPEYMNQFIKWGVVMRVGRLMFYCCSLYVIWKVIFKAEVKSA